MNKSGYSKLFIKTVLLSVFLSSGYSISSVYADVHISGNVGGISAEVRKKSQEQFLTKTENLSLVPMLWKKEQQTGR